MVRLYGCDTYDPSTGAVRETNTDDIDCWMIDTDHDSMSFIARLTYFPNGVRNRAGLQAAMKSLAHASRRFAGSRGYLRDDTM